MLLWRIRGFVQKVLHMNRTFSLLVAIALCQLSSMAGTIALWTFESPDTPTTTTASSISGLVASVGNGIASGVHTATDTVFSSQVGNGSASALNATRWTAGDYWQFHVSTVGFAQIQLSFDQTAFDNGPTNFTLQVSTDGINFVAALSFYQVFRNSTALGGGGSLWNSTTRASAYTRTVDLSSFSSLDNSPDAYFRLVDNITSPPMFQATAYGQIDNFEVTGTPVPEPSVLTLTTSLLTAGLFRRHRRARRLQS